MPLERGQAAADVTAVKRHSFGVSATGIEPTRTAAARGGLLRTGGPTPTIPPAGCCQDEHDAAQLPQSPLEVLGGMRIGIAWECRKGIGGLLERLKNSGHIRHRRCRVLGDRCRANLGGGWLSPLAQGIGADLVAEHQVLDLGGL